MAGASSEPASDAVQPRRTARRESGGPGDELAMAVPFSLESGAQYNYEILDRQLVGIPSAAGGRPPQQSLLQPLDRLARC